MCIGNMNKPNAANATASTFTVFCPAKIIMTAFPTKQAPKAKQIYGDSKTNVSTDMLAMTAKNVNIKAETIKPFFIGYSDYLVDRKSSCGTAAGVQTIG